MQWWSEKNILHIKSGIWKLKKKQLNTYAKAYSK